VRCQQSKKPLFLAAFLCLKKSGEMEKVGKVPSQLKSSRLGSRLSGALGVVKHLFQGLGGACRGDLQIVVFGKVHHKVPSHGLDFFEFAVDHHALEATKGIGHTPRGIA
jgi:hypothetical protein